MDERRNTTSELNLFRHQKDREFLRLDVHVDVQWSKIASSPQGSYINKDRTKNISQGGVCLQAYQKLSVGDKLKLKIRLPTKKTIEPTARVVWVGGYEAVGRKSQKRYDVGVAFLDLGDIDREEIRRFESNPYIYTA